MPSKNATRGNVLLVVVLTLAVLVGFVSVAYDYTAGTSRIAQRSYEMNGAYAVADGIVEIVYARWCAAMQMDPDTNYSVDELTTNGAAANKLKLDITRTADPAQPGGLLGGYDLAMAAGAPFSVDRIDLVLRDAYGRPLPSNVRPNTTNTNYDSANPTQPIFWADDPDHTGFKSAQITYEVTVQVTSLLHGNTDFTGARKGTPVVVRVSRTFTKRVIPTMQCAIFYEGDMELFPGSDMTVNGLVHTNQDFYAGGLKGAAKLDFKDMVSFVGTEHDTVGDHALQAYLTSVNNKQDSDLVDPTFSAGKPNRVERMNVGGIDPKDFDPKYVPVNSNNDSGYREIIERPTKSATASSLDPSLQSYDSYYDKDPSSIASQRLYNQACLKILVTKDSSGAISNVTVRTQTPTGMADGPLVSTGTTLYKDITAALSVNTADHSGAFYDQREGSASINVTTLDMSKLKSALEKAGSKLDYNGIVYVSDVTNAGKVDASGNAIDYATKPALLVTNGEKLPNLTPGSSADPTPFSLVTDDAVYIKGDYNTGGTGALVPSNAANATPASSTYAPGYVAPPSAIIADSVGVVSSNFTPWAGSAGRWDTFQNSDPTQTSTYLPDVNGKPDPRIGQLARGAVSTTLNTAMITGNVATSDQGPGDSSGGAQNLFRQLENWSDPVSKDQTRLTCNGSLMQMFRSKVLNGSFNNNFFENPIRDFRYDTTFLNKPPAGSTRIYSYSRGKWIRL